MFLQRTMRPPLTAIASIDVHAPMPTVTYLSWPPGPVIPSPPHAVPGEGPPSPAAAGTAARVAQQTAATTSGAFMTSSFVVSRYTPAAVSGVHSPPRTSAAAALVSGAMDLLRAAAR